MANGIIDTEQILNEIVSTPDSASAETEEDTGVLGDLVAQVRALVLDESTTKESMESMREQLNELVEMIDDFMTDSETEGERMMAEFDIKTPMSPPVED
jgi:DNA-binding ferritin-like protein (Dps family)